MMNFIRDVEPGHVFRLDGPVALDRHGHLDGWEGRLLDNILIARL